MCISNEVFRLKRQVTNPVVAFILKVVVAGEAGTPSLSSAALLDLNGNSLPLTWEDVYELLPLAEVRQGSTPRRFLMTVEFVYHQRIPPSFSYRHGEGDPGEEEVICPISATIKGGRDLLEKYYNEIDYLCQKYVLWKRG